MGNFVLIFYLLPVIIFIKFIKRRKKNLNDALCILIDSNFDNNPGAIFRIVAIDDDVVEYVYMNVNIINSESIV